MTGLYIIRPIARTNPTMLPRLRIVGEDVLFAHWPVEVSRLQSIVPDSFSIDTFQGTGWLTVLTHEVTEVGVGSTLSLPVPAFGEVDFRTYVTHDGDPGVLFISCNTSQALNAVLGERTFQLPYTHGSISIDRSGRDIIARCRNLGPTKDGRYDVRYGSSGPARPADEESLAEFLLERHTYYASRKSDQQPNVADDLTRGEVERNPWQLAPVEATLRTNTMFSTVGIEDPESSPVFHYSPRFESHFVNRQTVSC